MNKRLRKAIAAASALAVSATMLGGLAITATAADGLTTTKVTPEMTYIDYDAPDTAAGYVETATAGYNNLTNGTIGFKNISWKVDKIVYLKVDASSVTDTTIASARLSIDVSGSTDSERTTTYGAIYTSYTDWNDTLTYSIANTNNMLTGTQVGAEYTTTTKSSGTFETATIDITEALKNDSDRIVTIAIYETAAAGGYIKNPLVTIQSTSSADYIAPISSVVISGPDSMTFGPDPDTPADNSFSAVITDESGTTITESNIDSKVTDFNVVWDIDGFATENDQPGQYCDSYGAFTVNNSASTATSFALRNVPMNFFGKMTATVTYNGSIYTASKNVVALGNTTKATNVVLPAGGYPSDFNDYPDSLVGYTAAVSANNQSGTDIITGDFFVAGSDSGREAKLAKDTDGTKYFRITKTNASKSGMYAHSLSLSDGQTIFEQKVRFNAANNKITFTRGYPIWSSATSYAAIADLTFTGSGLTLDGTALLNGDAAATVNKNTWYNVVISLDTTTYKAWAKVFALDGTLVGEIDNVAFTKNDIPTYYAIGTDNSYTGTVDFGGYSIYAPIADTSTYTLSATKDTLSIPNGDTADLAASLKTADGYELSGAAIWTIVEEDMQAGVIITPDESDSHKAKVTLGEGAEAGAATVQVSIAGYTKTLTLNITSSAESVKFTKSSSSVSIPLDDTPMTAEYAASVVDGDGMDLGRSVTLGVYDKNNTAEYTLPEGISFDAAAGVLTVKKTASPCTFTIRATGANSDGESISKAVKVTVHGLSFDFGTAADDAVAEGYTAVAADTSYTAARGYGIASGTPAAAGTASTANADEDWLAGSFTFKANVTKGKLYTVNITYSGTLTTAYVNSDLAGYTLGTQDTLASVTYTFAVPTDVLDLTVTDGSIASVTITKNADRTARTKPVIHQVGDSTAANNGSWAYYISRNTSEFPTLTELCDFHSDGAGGRNLCTYYTEGKLAEVLNDIYPGDILMFGNNGTNGMGSCFETDVNYYLDAAEAMGAKIIINSYTPHGAVSNYAGNYNSTTHTFNGWRQDSYDVIVRAIAEQRAASDPNYIGFVEIGKNADAAFNAYVEDYAANGYESADAAAQAIIACFKDHNHYSEDTIACKLMLEGYGSVKGIIAQLAEWNITSENIGAEKQGDATSTGFKFTIENGLLYSGRSFNTYKGTVTSDNTTKSFESESTTVTLNNGADCIIGLFVEGLADNSATAALEVE